jgi:hypothetical protein
MVNRLKDTRVARTINSGMIPGTAYAGFWCAVFDFSR